MLNKNKRDNQHGAVSLFVVIFAMLIITVVTVSFLKLMMADQRQSTDNDLSKSAYDSATSGVEDAKRSLLRFQQVCNNTPSDCSTLASKLTTDECNAALTLGDVVNPGDINSGGVPVGSTGEIKIQQSSDGKDSSYDQAYTCVTIKLSTDDYVGSLVANDSKVVPLVGETSYDTVTVNWFNRDDVTSSDGSVTLPGVSANHPLKNQSDWGSNTPSVMRVQLIQFGSSGFLLSGFDSVDGASSNSNTVFLYPTSGVGSTLESFMSLDNRSNAPGDNPDPVQATSSPHAVKCQASVSAGGYACSMSLTLPPPIGGGDRTAFLRITPMYKASHFQIILTNGGVPISSGANVVKFKNVQPLIDSTGRANDVFRRVQSRVDLYNTAFPYPDATIDITGNICKDFGVSDKPDVYSTSNTCTP